MRKIILGAIVLMSLNAYSNPSSDPAYYGSCLSKERSVIQSFVIDNDAGEAFGYNLKRISKDADDFGAIISAYPLKKGDMHYKFRYGPYEQLGHQGLAVQYREGVRYFWSSLGHAYADDSGSYAVRYRLDDGEIKDFTTFKLFQKNKTRQSTSPTVSYDGKYLLARMVRSSDFLIRVFHIDQFDKSGDYSKKSKYSFLIPKGEGKSALQAMASDSRFVYILMGDVIAGGKNQIDIYTYSGTHVRSVAVHQGEQDAKSLGSEGHYEPESLTWLKQGNKVQLMITVAAGDMGDRRCLVYGTEIFADES